MRLLYIVVLFLLSSCASYNEDYCDGCDIDGFATHSIQRNMIEHERFIHGNIDNRIDLHQQIIDIDEQPGLPMHLHNVQPPIYQGNDLPPPYMF